MASPQPAGGWQKSRESVEAGAVTQRFCLHCGRHYDSGTGVRGRCDDCGRAYDRQLSRQERARRTGTRHASEDERTGR